MQNWNIGDIVNVGIFKNLKVVDNDGKSAILEKNNKFYFYEKGKTKLID